MGLNDLSRLNELLKPVLCLAGVSSVLALAFEAQALPNFKFEALTLEDGLATANGVKSAIQSRVNGLSDAELVKAAMHGQLGACTYSDAVGPLSNFAWGFIKVGQDKSQNSQLSMSGPKKNNNKAISGIVYKSTIRALVHPNIRSFFGTNLTSRDEQVARALRDLADDADDPCRLTLYSQKLAAQINRLNTVASNMSNIIHKKMGDSILPGECGVRLSKVPVSNLSSYLDSASASPGCAFVLRKLPERFCQYVYVSDRVNITGARALTGSKFDLSAGLTQVLNSTPADKLALLTHDVPANIGVKALLDLRIDTDDSEISNWQDPRNITQTCYSPEGYNNLRSCSFQGGPGCSAYNVPVLSADLRHILKLWHQWRNVVPGDASASPLGAIGSNAKLKALLDYYSGVTGGGGGAFGGASNMLSGNVTGLDATTVSAVGTTVLPTSAAFQPRRIPVDKIQEIASIELPSGTTPILKNSSGQTLSISAINCDETPANAAPGPIDLLSDTYAPAPVKPTSAGTWAPTAANLNTATATGGTCPTCCGN